ncbi:MAG: hypothetical protein H0W73_16655 [Bacteroidetes bacterium]|nr:hypothetical protein [Bacteroidota bacterium]
MKKLIFVLIFLPVFSCKEDKSKNIQEIIQPSVYNSSSEILKNDSLLNLAVSTGNETMYANAYSYYWLTERAHLALYPSIIMSDKYNCAMASFNAYLILTQQDGRVGKENNKSNKRTNCLAMYYLLKAYELKDSNAEIEVKSLFSSLKIPKSNSFLVDMSKID